MNKVQALGQLGFEENYDYVATEANGVQTIEWLSETPEPSQAEMQASYDELLKWNPIPVLFDYQQQAKYEIDQYSEYARLRHITSGSGQSMVYQEKAADAARHKADGYPSGLGLYPWIKAEVDATSLSPQAASNLILAQRSAWVLIGTEIEKNRRFWKLEVDKATDEAGVEFAKDRAQALLEAL
jgi:hypothetical protein